jgi:hypothetical protein
MYLPEWFQVFYAWGAAIYFFALMFISIKERANIFGVFFVGLVTAGAWFVFLPLLLHYTKNKKR